MINSFLNYSFRNIKIRAFINACRLITENMLKNQNLNNIYFKSLSRADSPVNLKACIVGFGNVGKSFAKILIDKRDELESIGIKLDVICIATKSSKVYNENGIDISKAIHSLKGVGKEFDDLFSVLREKEFDYLFDFSTSNYIDGEPGYSIIKEALNNGINVITTNKAPLALHFKELVNLAKSKKVKFRYQATVMSGTPSINLKEVLPLCKVTRIRGILNGTTNFILSKMEEGLSFDEALNQAKFLGYVEKDPGIDISGLDAAAKLTILINTYFGSEITIDKIKIKGIDGITSERIIEAKKKNRKIKLIADSSDLSVSPVEVDEKDVLYFVNGVDNCLELKTDFGKVSIIGKGAGPVSAAYGAFSDFIIAQREIY